MEQFAHDEWNPRFGAISGAVLEELLPVGSPLRISSGRTASHGRDPTLEHGQRVTEKERWRRSAIDHP